MKNSVIRNLVNLMDLRNAAEARTLDLGCNPESTNAACKAARAALSKAKADLDAASAGADDEYVEALGIIAMRDMMPPIDHAYQVAHDDLIRAIKAHGSIIVDNSRRVDLSLRDDVEAWLKDNRLFDLVFVSSISMISGHITMIAAEAGRHGEADIGCLDTAKDFADAIYDLDDALSLMTNEHNADLDSAQQLERVMQSDDAVFDIELQTLVIPANAA